MAADAEAEASVCIGEETADAVQVREICNTAATNDNEEGLVGSASHRSD